MENMSRKECRKLEQLYNRYGDPINSCSDGLEAFIQEYRKRNPEDTGSDRSIKETLYEDFYYNKNMIMDDYFKKLEE